MPHFIVDCSDNVLKIHSSERILKEIYGTALLTSLFSKNDIKVRIRTFKDFTVGNTKADFIHIFGNIMEGRNTDQKADLSKAVIKKMKSMFPNVPVISINIRDFEKATYCNRDMV